MAETVLTKTAKVIMADPVVASGEERVDVTDNDAVREACLAGVEAEMARSHAALARVSQSQVSGNIIDEVTTTFPLKERIKSQEPRERCYKKKEEEEKRLGREKEKISEENVKRLHEILEENVKKLHKLQISKDGINVRLKDYKKELQHLRSKERQMDQTLRKKKELQPREDELACFTKDVKSSTGKGKCIMNSSKKNAARDLQKQCKIKISKYDKLTPSELNHQYESTVSGIDALEAKIQSEEEYLEAVEAEMRLLEH